MASNAHPPPTCSPSPPSLASSSDERPVTPGLGIPMEMTPGQIMEAEISASFLDDDDVQHPQHTGLWPKRKINTYMYENFVKLISRKNS